MDAGANNFKQNNNFFFLHFFIFFYSINNQKYTKISFQNFNLRHYTFSSRTTNNNNKLEKEEKKKKKNIYKTISMIKFDVELKRINPLSQNKHRFIKQFVILPKLEEEEKKEVKKKQ